MKRSETNYNRLNDAILKHSGEIEPRHRRTIKHIALIIDCYTQPSDVGRAELKLSAGGYPAVRLPIGVGELAELVFTVADKGQVKCWLEYVDGTKIASLAITGGQDIWDEELSLNFEMQIAGSLQVAKMYAKALARPIK